MKTPGLTKLSKAQLEKSKETKPRRHVVYTDSDTSQIPARKAVRLNQTTTVVNPSGPANGYSVEQTFHPTEYFINDDEDELQQVVPFEWMDPSFTFELDERTGIAPKRQRNPANEHPLLGWMPRREEFLREFLCLEGRGLDEEAMMSCSGCGSSNAPAYFRCESCFDLRMFCARCIVCNHAPNPFHWIQQWEGTHFVRRSLRNLDFFIQLGHPIGEPCTMPIDVKNELFIVLHTNGVHTIKLKYCNCPLADDRIIQLLRFRLFPATVKYPRTAATFEVLNLFQILGFMSKASGFELFQTLVRLTNNIGDPVPNRYKSLMCMLHEWRHIVLMKRMGRGHVVGGIAATAPGSCAVLCPACPHPGINLPPDYNKGPLSKTWIYSLFLHMDANFRLKRLNVSSDANDPGLNDGVAFVVNEKPYKEFLMEYGDKVVVDPSVCNNHDAIKSANVRAGKGFAATGVGTVDCRHDMKRPNSIGDLQKGERYVNMDYLFISNLRRNAPARVNQSYDIVCQWYKNLLTRLALYAPTISLCQPHIFNFFIPKWHIAAHRDACQTDFSFYWSPYVGRTDGEAPERGWAAMNGIASSTKEMGPGSRRDTLDDFVGDYNWRKEISLPEALLTKIKDAVPERSDHVNCFIELCDCIAETAPDLIKTWTDMVQAWERDREQLNPFVSTQKVLSINQVRLELASEDQKTLAQGEPEDEAEVHQETTASEFLSQGIELEDLQSTLAADYAKLSLHPTELQKAKLLERRNRLFRRILAWIELQKEYMTGISRERKDSKPLNEGIAETIPLVMPSAVVGSKKVTLSQDLLDYEWRYRSAQIGTTLEDLRRHLLLRDQLWSSTNRHVHGQNAGTRSKGILHRVEDKITNDAEKYRRVREQLSALSKQVKNDGTWQTQWLPLQESDVSGLKNFDEGMRPTLEDGHVSVGKRKLSWIWHRSGVIDNTKLRTEAVRIEWCKARARAHRWQEECHLLQEEMRRVKAYFQYRADEWRRIASTPLPLQPDNRPLRARQEQEGRQAYAQRQATIFDSLFIRCITAWKDCEGYCEMGEGAPVDGVVHFEYKVAVKAVETA